MNGYNIFLVVELGKLRGVINSNLEYDLLWEEATKLYEEFEKSTFNDENRSEYDCIDAFLDSKIEYRLSENSINGIKIKEKIFDDELFEYKIIDRKDFLDELTRWIGEARDSDKILMKQDLETLLTVSDEYIFSSISTNEYLYNGCADFEKTCKELLELNEEL